MSKRSAALARMRQLACLGLPGGLFISSLLPVLRELIHSDSAAFFWLDSSGGISNFFADRFPSLDSVSPSVAPAPVFMSESARWSDSPLRPFVDSIVASTVEREAASNGLYNAILKQNGAHYTLHGIVRHEGAIIGRLSLFRTADGRAFNPREIGALESVIRYAAHGLVGDELLGEGDVDGDDVLEEELLIADGAGQVLHATEGGRRLMLLSSGCPLGPRTLALAHSVSLQLLRALCAGQPANEASRVAPTNMSRDTTWGRFVIRGYRLHDEMQSGAALVGVHILRNQPACLRFVSAMSALPLSPQQREIALLIARGRTNRDIAMRLSVSINTVAYHIKQLFYKLRVHDRAGLLARINSSMASAETPLARGAGRGPPASIPPSTPTGLRLPLSLTGH